MARLVLNGSPMAREFRRARQRGYTLVELMTVVVIVGVLATIATIGVRKYVFAAKTSEALQMIQSIKSAQEAYKAETFVYSGPSTSLTDYYPADPDKNKRSWDRPADPRYAKWLELGVRTTAPVQFGYAARAGGPATAVEKPSLLTQTLTFPDPPNEPWYVIVAVGDQNGDGVKSVYFASSFVGEVSVQNPDE
jgi:prepilin-type N-terminal cleavage/methylation domain-containing protein